MANDEQTTDDWRAEYREALERAIRAENALRSVRVVAENASWGSWRFKVAGIVDKALPNG